MSGISRLILDVLKPHKPSIHTMAQELVGAGGGIEGVNITLMETDRNTQSIKIIIQGVNLDYSVISASLEEMNAAIHSLDQVICGDVLVEDVPTPQDKTA